MQCGIYCIRCFETNKVYIGSSKNIKQRKMTHFYALDGNRHRNKELQNDYNKFGSDKFIFDIIEYCDENVLIEREQFHVDNNSNLYNKNKPGRNNLITEETRKKMSLSQKNKKKHKFTENTKNKMSKSKLAENNPMTTLNLEECFKIKEMLLEITTESQSKKYERLSQLFNVSISTIKNIKGGRHWASKELGGSYINWIENNSNNRKF